MRSQFTSVMTLAATLAVSSVEAYWGTAHLLGKFQNQSLKFPFKLHNFLWVSLETLSHIIL